MLIPNPFIYLFNILCKDFFFNNKEGCRNKVFPSHSMSHYHKRRYHFSQLNNWVLCVEATVYKQVYDIAVYQETIYYYYYYYYLIKRMFSSIWLIWKVVAIRFFHRKQCLTVTSFDIVPSASLHLNQFSITIIIICISISKRWFCY